MGHNKAGFFVIDSCCLVSQSSCLNSSNKHCDCGLILAYFRRVQMHAYVTFTPLDYYVWFKNFSRIVV